MIYPIYQQQPRLTPISPKQGQRLRKNSQWYKLKPSKRNRLHKILEPITEIEVLKKTKKLKNKLSLDHTGFSSNLLKIVTPSISSCFCDQFNKIMDTGVYPECLKAARVIPIHKEGPLSDPTDYRPISLIPVSGKIFEKVLQSRLMSWLIKNDVS